MGQLFLPECMRRAETMIVKAWEDKSSTKVVKLWKTIGSLQFTLEQLHDQPKKSSAQAVTNHLQVKFSTSEINFQQFPRATKLDFLKSSVSLTWVVVCPREVGSAKQVELCNTSYSWGCYENWCIGLQLKYVTWGQFCNLFLDKYVHKILSLCSYSTNAQVYEFTTFTPWEQSWIWVSFFKQSNHWKWILVSKSGRASLLLSIILH